MFYIIPLFAPDWIIVARSGPLLAKQQLIDLKVYKSATQSTFATNKKLFITIMIIQLCAQFSISQL